MQNNVNIYESCGFILFMYVSFYHLIFTMTRTYKINMSMINMHFIIDRISGKRFPPGQSNKFRHHSVDDDYYAYYNYYNYGYHDRYGMQFSSQPSLVRNGVQRDSKYQHPHARYGAGHVRNMGFSFLIIQKKPSRKNIFVRQIYFY